MALHHTDPEIAELLVLSVRTVNTHVSHLMAKLGVKRRGEAARLWKAKDQ